MSGRKPNAVLKSYEYAMTLEQISRELGVSRERARQLEARALAKARMILEKWGYRLEDLLSDDARNDEFLHDLAPEGEGND